MRNGLGWKRGLAAMGIGIWLVAGAAAMASAYPAPHEDFGSRTGTSSCAAAQGLAPQLRKEAGLRAACAPSAPIVEVDAPAQPVTVPTSSPSFNLIPWLAVAAAFVTAVTMATIRVRHSARPAA